jgi:hypothetical protein
MTWLPLESDMLASVAYDAEKQILHQRFRKTGDVYRYFGFPAAEHQAFLDAESHGRFFLAYIRDKYLRTHGETPRRLICQHGLARTLTMLVTSEDILPTGGLLEVDARNRRLRGAIVLLNWYTC